VIFGEGGASYSKPSLLRLIALLLPRRRGLGEPALQELAHQPQQALAVGLELAELHEERGEVERAIEVLRRALEAEPAREEAHAGLMRLYALSGRRGEAIRQYERLREIPSRELGARPTAANRFLHEEILAERFPPTRPSRKEEESPTEEPPGDGRHNLPSPKTGFVGRKREILEVKRLLSMTRLLTLTGAGGSGKTRLALEVAKDLVAAHPDGVRLVELAGLSDPGLVMQTVAAVYGVYEQAGRPLEAKLADYLRTKDTLLVLDNCEHLIDATARLTDALLGSCPRLRVLATSREALNTAGELN